MEGGGLRRLSMAPSRWAPEARLIGMLGNERQTLPKRMHKPER